MLIKFLAKLVKKENKVFRSLDFINVMAYDFHGGWDAVTGHHSALGSNPSLDLGANAQLNTNYSINYWIEKGAPPEKLIVGMGTYGRGWLLDNPDQNGLYAPASQPIPAGPYTREPGYWGYNEICDKVKQEQGQWTEVTDAFYQSPYSYNGRNWIGYDSPTSIVNKARFVNELGLGGGMFWSLETDDFLGSCHGEKFPIINAFRKAL